jgi:hypothetical protein
MLSIQSNMHEVAFRCFHWMVELYISPKPQIGHSQEGGGGHLFGNTPLPNCCPVHFIISLPLLRSRHKIFMDIMCAPNTLGTFSECFTYGCKVRHKFIVCLLIQGKEKPCIKICRGEVYMRKIQNWVWFLQLVSNQNQNRLRTRPKIRFLILFMWGIRTKG